MVLPIYAELNFLKSLLKAIGLKSPRNIVLCFYETNLFEANTYEALNLKEGIVSGNGFIAPLTAKFCANSPVKHTLPWDVSAEFRSKQRDSQN